MSSSHSRYNPEDNSLEILDLEAYAAEQELKELVRFYGADPDDPNSVMEARRLKHERTRDVAREQYIRDLEEGVRAALNMPSILEESVEIMERAVKTGKKKAQAKKRQKRKAASSSTLRGDTERIFWLAIHNFLTANATFEDGSETDEQGDFVCDLTQAYNAADLGHALYLIDKYLDGDDDRFARDLMSNVLIGTSQYEDGDDTVEDHAIPAWYEGSFTRNRKFFVRVSYPKKRGGGVQTAEKEFSLAAVLKAVDQVRKTVTPKRLDT